MYSLMFFFITKYGSALVVQMPFELGQNMDAPLLPVPLVVPMRSVSWSRTSCSPDLSYLVVIS